MSNFKFFFLLLLLQYVSMNAFYLSRAQLATRQFSKKHIFKNMSRLKKRFFSLVRHRFRRLVRRSLGEGGSFSVGGLFSPKTKKTIYKKPQMLKNVIGYQKKNILHKKSLNLKTSIKRYYQDSGDYDKVKNSLSFKYAQAKSLEELKDFFQKVTQQLLNIKDMNFAMEEVTQALEREQNAQAENKFVAYHAMPAPIFLLLNAYTKIYDKLHNQITPEYFTYLRAFESISNKKELERFLQGHFLDPLRFSDLETIGSNHLFSLNPFLFQTKSGESAFGRDAPDFQIIKSIRSNISELLKLDPVKSQDSLRQYNLLGGKNIFLQIIFEKNSNNEDSLTDIKNKSERVYPKDIYVGYDENDIFFSNLYWSGPSGVPAPYGSQSGKYKYNGADMFKKMLKGEKTPAADIAQLRLLITPEYLKEKKYRVHIVDINNQFQDFDQKVNELTGLILKEVEKQSSQQTKEKKVLVD